MRFSREKLLNQFRLNNYSDSCLLKFKALLISKSLMACCCCCCWFGGGNNFAVTLNCRPLSFSIHLNFKFFAQILHGRTLQRVSIPRDKQSQTQTEANFSVVFAYFVKFILFQFD